MKTPHAVLIGLSLIAAAIHFKEPFVKPAHAFGGPDHIACGIGNYCYAFNGNTITAFAVDRGMDNWTVKWHLKTGKVLEKRF